MRTLPLTTTTHTDLLRRPNVTVSDPSITPCDNTSHTSHTSCPSSHHHNTRTQTCGVPSVTSDRTLGLGLRRDSGESEAGEGEEVPVTRLLLLADAAAAFVTLTAAGSGNVRGGREGRAAVSRESSAGRSGGETAASSTVLVLGSK